MKKVLLLIPILIAVCLNGFAQSGDEFFNKKDYHNAITRYETEVHTSPDKYLNLAKAHFALKEFDESILALKAYKSKYATADAALANRWLELLERNDDYVEVKNVGAYINSGVDDYFPVVSLDGKRIYFAADDRPGGQGGNDIWYSDKMADGNWGAAKTLSDLNTNSHEAIMSMSGDQNVVILFGNYDGSFGRGDLFYTVNTASGWTFPCNVGGTVNTNEWESQANLASDGKTLLFCSDRDKSGGVSDIYVTQLTENGWTAPINLGPTINTPNSEASPMLAADGKTLYFHSSGHPGFGGTDIFMSRRTGDSWTSWTKPMNMGKYINTMDNDKYMTIPASGIKAYTVRNSQVDGYGEDDIYEFIIPPGMRPEMVINVSGVVADENNNPVGAKIRFIETETGKEYANAISNFSDGVYKISLPPLKKYDVVIDMKGFLYYTDVLDLTDMSQFLKDESVLERLKPEMSNIIRAQQQFKELDNKLATLLSTDESNLSNGFNEFGSLADEYKTTARNLDISIKRAKLQWLSEENELLDVVKNFQLQTITVGATFELKNIFFDFGKASLRNESMLELNKLVDIMKRSMIAIELGGHTDDVGSDENNLRLSQERVNSVKQYLVENDIAAFRIAAVGYGEKAPIASNESDEGRQKNRRVEVKITEINAREGSDVVSNEDAVEEEPQTEQLDFLETLRAAARIGGLPEGSPCSNEVTYIGGNNTGSDIVYTDNSGGNLDLSWLDGLGGEKIAKGNDNHIYNSFNLSYQNFGYKIVDGSLSGLGLNLVNKKNRELHFEFYPLGTDDIPWQAGLGVLWNWQVVEKLPILIAYGANMNVYGFDGEDIEGNAGSAFFNIPLGLRYIHKITDDLVIGPEFIYELGFDSKISSNIMFNDNPEAENKLKSTYMKIGVNARWKFIQGGVHFNKGDYIDYFGIRAGVAF